jgi:hypothetical protein
MTGNSPDALRVLEFAKESCMVTIGLSQKTGDKMNDLFDHCWCVPNDSILWLRETQTLISHIPSGIVENACVTGISALSSANVNTIS